MAWSSSFSDLFDISNLSHRLKSLFQLPRRLTRDLLLGLLLGISLSLSSTSAALLLQQYRQKQRIKRIPPRPIELRADEIGNGVVGLIGETSHPRFPLCRRMLAVPVTPECELRCGSGNTPLIRINSLSDALGVEILVRQSRRVPK